MTRRRGRFINRELELLAKFTSVVNGEEWKFLTHSMNKLKYRCGRDANMTLQEILDFIRSTTLNAKDIFEAYFDGNRVLKACYRFPFSKMKDIILVVASGKDGTGKELVTVYWNSKYNLHSTFYR